MGVTEPYGEGQPNDGCHAKAMHFRDRWATKQASAFAKLGLVLSNHPWPVVIAVLLVFVGLGCGITTADLETDPSRLWVQMGSRLEGEREHYESIYGDLPRGIMVHIEDPNGGSVLTTKHLEEAYDLDGSFLDLRLHHNSHPANPCRYAELVALNQSEGNPQLSDEEKTKNYNTVLKTACGSEKLKLLCVLQETSTRSQCLTHDKAGVLPTVMQNNPLVYEWEHEGRKLAFGMRELCTEVPFPEYDPAACSVPNKPRVCNIAFLRAPCSKMFTPMDCFKELPRGYPDGPVMEAWPANHQVSYKDEARRGQALAAPCKMWQGSYNVKGFTLGGATYQKNAENITEITDLKAFRLTYALDSPVELVKKYNYIMKHPTSGMFYKNAGYPDTITEDQARAIIDGYEELTNNFLSETSGKYRGSKITWINMWMILRITEEASQKNQIFVVIGLVLLLVVVWASLFRMDMVANRLSLGLGGVVCIAISVFATLGFSALCDVQFNGLSLQVLPYVCMGLGIDDMFVLLHYFEENVEKPVGERMQMAYAHGGPSITATSLVNIVVFFLGVTVPVKAVNDFAIQTGIAVVFNYLVVLLAFGAIMAIDAHRIYARRMDVVCLKREKPAPMPSESCARMVIDKGLGPLVTSPIGQALGLIATAALLGVSIWGCHEIELGLALKSFTEEGTMEFDFLVTREKYFRTDQNYVVGRQMDVADEQVQRTLTQLVISNLTHPENAWAAVQRMNNIDVGTMQYAAKTFLISSIAWNTVFRRISLLLPAGQSRNNKPYCVVSPSNEGLFLPSDCIVNSTNYYDLVGYLFGYRGACKGDKPWNRSSSPIPSCGEMDAYLNLHAGEHPENANCSTFSSSQSDCKANGCLFWQNGTEGKCTDRCSNIPAKDPCEANGCFYDSETNICTNECAKLKTRACVLNGCIPSGGSCTHSLRGAMVTYGSSITPKMEGNNVVGMEAFSITIINEPFEQSDTQSTLDMMEEHRRLLDSSGIPVYVYGSSFLYGEQYRFTRENLRTVLAITLACSLVLMSILMSSIVIGIIQTVVITMSMVAILATLPLLDLGLNGVSLLSAVFGVGINVELAVHISRAFLTAQSDNPSPFAARKERVTTALRLMSAPVFSGALTTFVGVLILVASDVEFFRDYFFKLYSMMILISLFHAFVPLPILLCFVGPEPLPDHDDEVVEKVSNPVQEEVPGKMNIEMEAGDKHAEDDQQV